MASIVTWCFQRATKIKCEHGKINRKFCLVVMKMNRLGIAAVAVVIFNCNGDTQIQVDLAWATAKF